MKKMINYLKKNEKGQGVMEYIIISSLIGILCLGLFKGFGDTLKKKVKYMKTQINQTIKS